MSVDALVGFCIGATLGVLTTLLVDRIRERRAHRKKMYEDVLPHATGIRAGKVSLEKAGQLLAQLQVQAKLAGDHDEDREHLRLILIAHGDAGIAEKQREGVALGLGATATPPVTMVEAHQRVDIALSSLEARFADYQRFCGKQLQGWRSDLRDRHRARDERRREREWARRHR